MITINKKTNYKDRVTPERVTELKENEVFVFGSNLAGIHGAGAAKDALKFGAEMGNGVAWSGQTYALPTKDKRLRTMPLHDIAFYLGGLCATIYNTQESIFLVTEIGCGLAGYTPDDIAPFFKPIMNCPNLYLPQRFWNVLLKEENEI
jgi:hypothetical protein